MVRVSPVKPLWGDERSIKSSGARYIPRECGENRPFLNNLRRVFSKLHSFTKKFLYDESMKKNAIANFRVWAGHLFGPHQDPSGLVLRARVRSQDGLQVSAVTSTVTTQEVVLVSSTPIGVGEVVLELDLDEAGLFPVRFKGVCNGGHAGADGRVQVAVDIRSSNPRALAVLKRQLDSREKARERSA